MKFLIPVLAFLLLSLAPSARAAETLASKPPHFPDSAFMPLSLEELEALPLEKRIRYLENLKELMIDLEAMWERPSSDSNGSKSSASNSLLEFKEYSFLISAMIEEAQAASKWDRWYIDPVPNRISNQPCGPVFKAVLVNKRTRACVIQGRYRQTACPANTLAVNQRGNGEFTCMSRSSFSMLSEADKRAMRAWNIYASKNPKLKATNKAYRAVATAFDNQRAADAERAAKRKLATAKAATPKKASGLKTRSTAGTAQPSAVDSEAESSNSSDVVAVTPSDEQPSETYSTIAGVDIEKVTAQMEDDVEKSEKARKEKLDLCVGPEEEIDKKCPTEMIDEGRRALYGTDKAMCIYAGNFSYYQTKTATPGKCRPVFEFCFGKASCRKADGSKEDGVGRPEAACGAGQVICNPYIFSLQTDGKPFCVKPDKNATRNCVELTRNQKTLRPYVDREWKSALYQHASHSEDKTSQFQNWFSGFSAFKEKIQEMCFSNENMKKAFCLECNLIKRRLIWMKADLIGGNPDQCSEFKGFETDTDAIKRNKSRQTEAPAAAPTNQ